jgi:hypothetical protein
MPNSGSGWSGDRSHLIAVRAATSANGVRRMTAESTPGRNAEYYKAWRGRCF